MPRTLAGDRCRIEVLHDPLDTVRGAHALYNRCVGLDGPGGGAAGAEQAFAGWCLDEALLSEADSRAIVLHCLPAHRGEEISAG